jgi:hypothetical protein
MANSKHIAGYVGPMMVALGASEALNFGIWEQIVPAVVYLNGTLLLLAGLVLIRAHNVWVFRWPVLITVTGWSLLAAGLYRMFMPAAQQAQAGTLIYVLFAVLVLVGLFMTYQGFGQGFGQGLGLDKDKGKD